MPAYLLVDADRNFRRALEIALRLDGAEVVGSASVAEAVTLLEAGRFDLVAADSLLAGVDALFERAAAVGTPAVATGPHRELLERAARRHAVATLEKPFFAQQLVAAVARAPARAVV